MDECGEDIYEIPLEVGPCEGDDVIVTLMDSCIACGELASVYSVEGEVIKKEMQSDKYMYSQLFECFCDNIGIPRDSTMRSLWDFHSTPFPFCQTCEKTMIHLADYYLEIKKFSKLFKAKMGKAEEKFVMEKLYQKNDQRHFDFRKEALGEFFKGNEQFTPGEMEVMKNTSILVANNPDAYGHSHEGEELGYPEDGYPTENESTIDKSPNPYNYYPGDTDFYTEDEIELDSMIDSSDLMGMDPSSEEWFKEGKGFLRGDGASSVCTSTGGFTTDGDDSSMGGTSCYDTAMESELDDDTEDEMFTFESLGDTTGLESDDEDRKVPINNAVDKDAETASVVCLTRKRKRRKRFRWTKLKSKSRRKSNVNTSTSTIVNPPSTASTSIPTPISGQESEPNMEAMEQHFPERETSTSMSMSRLEKKRAKKERKRREKAERKNRARSTSTKPEEDLTSFQLDNIYSAKVDLVPGLFGNIFFRNLCFVRVEEDGMFVCSTCSRRIPIEDKKYKSKNSLKTRLHAHFIKFHSDRYQCHLCPDVRLYNNDLELQRHLKKYHNYNYNYNAEKDFEQPRKRSVPPPRSSSVPKKVNEKRKKECLICGKMVKQPGTEEYKEHWMSHMNQAERKKFLQNEKTINETNEIINESNKKRSRQLMELESENFLQEILEVRESEKKKKLSVGKGNVMGSKIDGGSGNQKKVSRKLGSKGKKIRSALQNHSQSHPQMKYRCRYPNCDTVFDAANSLEKHVEESHGKPSEDRHLCHLCGRIFSTGGLLIRHGIIHSGEKLPYRCTKCGKGFQKKNSLRNHVSVSHDENGWGLVKCTEQGCDAVFPSSSYLARHRRSFHNTCLRKLEAARNSNRLVQNSPGVTIALEQV